MCPSGDSRLGLLWESARKLYVIGWKNKSDCYSVRINTCGLSRNDHLRRGIPQLPTNFKPTTWRRTETRSFLHFSSQRNNFSKMFCQPERPNASSARTGQPPKISFHSDCISLTVAHSIRLKLSPSSYWWTIWMNSSEISLPTTEADTLLLSFICWVCRTVDHPKYRFADRAGYFYASFHRRSIWHSGGSSLRGSLCRSLGFNGWEGLHRVRLECFVIVLTWLRKERRIECSYDGMERACDGSFAYSF